MEERIFSVELNLCMKGYCNRDSRAIIFPIVKTKVQLVLGKTLEMNEFSENECLPNYELKLKFLENLWKPLSLKSTRKRIGIDFLRVSNVWLSSGDLKNRCRIRPRYWPIEGFFLN